MTRSLHMSMTNSTYKPLFTIFQVLYKKESVVREAHIHILDDLKEDREGPSNQNQDLVTGN